MSANKTDRLWYWLIAITVIFSCFITLIVFTSPHLDKLSIQQQLQYKNQALTTTAIVFLGMGVIINAYYAAKSVDATYKSAVVAEKNLEINLQNAKLSQDRFVSERLMAAISQLGHDKIETRTSAIYILERLAQDCPQEHWIIMEILTAFVRENAIITEAAEAREEDFSPYFSKYKNGERRGQHLGINLHEESIRIRRDIQAALTVIGRRNFQQDEASKKLDLRYTDLRRVDLLGANLQQADLRGADLRLANLRDCNLGGANLESAKLTGSILYEANLLKANLQGANLNGTNLNRAEMSGANLRGATLVGASLRAANLQGANLYKANLQQASLKLANLSGAKLFLANLQGAKLGKANLYLCGLIGADLQRANLNGANLFGANLNAAKLQQTEILFADLTGASLTEANLYQANLMGANLQRVTLYEANLTQANLVGANLSDTNFCDVKLEGAILTGAKNLEAQQICLAVGDRTTRLPDNMEVPIHWEQSS
ncbi:pentapeptide repeat-containing protein [Anabaena sp. 4-3]|uniref:pentapeptide repeat-containing protein n=1 Tax=Anabaena sp. 4-3 TaxID=1811979 RepID=UPI0008346E91|nr:pentapeptide repeat-containing protein [Anabaena sp. 4-3]